MKLSLPNISNCNKFTCIVTAANEVCEGYVFTGVCLSTGGVWPIHPPGQTALGQTPALGRQPPWADSPLRSACWDTVNKWAVCIPLECILVIKSNRFRPPFRTASGHWQAVNDREKARVNRVMRFVPFRDGEFLRNDSQLMRLWYSPLVPNEFQLLSRISEDFFFGLFDSFLFPQWRLSCLYLL